VWDLSRRAPLQPPLAGHTGPIEAVAVGEVNGGPIAVTGSADTTVRVWDLNKNAAAGPPLGERQSGLRLRRVRHGHSGPVTAVAVGQLDGHPIAVSGSDDGTAQIWDLEHDSWAGNLPSGESVPHGFRRIVTAVALGEMDDQLIAIIAPTVTSTRAAIFTPPKPLQVWDLSRRALIAMSDPTRGEVEVLAVGKLDDRLIALVSGRDRTVNVW